MLTSDLRVASHHVETTLGDVFFSSLWVVFFSSAYWYIFPTSSMLLNIKVQLMPVFVYILEAE